MSNDNDKFVDESWKDNVAKEKDSGCGEGCGCGEGDACGDDCGHDHGAPEVNFLNYVMSMGYQAMIFLGEVPHPMTGKPEKNLRQAKFLIDTLVLLRDKTKNNLDPQEDNLLNASIFELQTKYVEVADKESAGPKLI